jgi:hypothetical protein
MDLELTDEQRLIRETARDLGSDLTGLLLAGAVKQRDGRAAAHR